MRRSGVAKFPHSVQLFKFSQKVLIDRKGGKVHDQEVGSILSFNPSDCSHWKRGEKNVKSVFSLAKLAEALRVEPCLIHDLASGQIGLDEAFFEYSESNEYGSICRSVSEVDTQTVGALRQRIEKFVKRLLDQAEFATPPLYLPEVLRFFPFLTAQPADMMDRLSRILRIRPGQYTIQFKKGELKPQTRVSVVRDLARIVFEAERDQFPELETSDASLLQFEKLLFSVELLAPRSMLKTEIGKLDSRKNVVAELATLFWVPKSLISFQLQDMVRTGRSSEQHRRVEQDRRIRQDAGKPEAIL